MHTFGRPPPNAMTWPGVFCSWSLELIRYKYVFLTPLDLAVCSCFSRVGERSMEGKSWILEKTEDDGEEDGRIGYVHYYMREGFAVALEPHQLAVFSVTSSGKKGRSRDFGVGTFILKRVPQ